MPDTNTSFLTPRLKVAPFRYFACLRPQDILVLQGSPLLGVAIAARHPGLHELGPLAILLLANVLLVTHIFLLNDWSGLTADLADPNKAARVFTARGVERSEMAALTVGVLVASLALFSRLGPIPFGLALAIAILSALYSLPIFDWKGKPFLNSVAHIAGGILHFLLGYAVRHPIDRRGIAIATFFALVFAAGHLTQEIRDHHGDALQGIRTNAVLFGPRRTFAASLALFALAHLLLFSLALEGILPRVVAAIAALYALQLWWSRQALGDGLTYASICALQRRYRGLYAVIGVAIVAALALPH